MLQNNILLKLILEPLLVFVLAYVLIMAIYKNFKHKKTWERKYVAYLKIITAIKYIRFWAGETYCDSYISSQDVIPDEKPMSFSEGLNDLDKFIHEAKSLLPENFISYIEQVTSEFWQKKYRALEDGAYRDLPEASKKLALHLVNVLSIAETHLPTIIELTKDDLNGLLRLLSALKIDPPSGSQIDRP